MQTEERSESRAALWSPGLLEDSEEKGSLQSADAWWQAEGIVEAERGTFTQPGEAAELDQQNTGRMSVLSHPGR